MRRLSIVLAVVALIAVAAPATAEPPRLAKYVDRFTTAVPGASSGRHAETDLVNPQDPEGKPESFSHVHVEFAPGTVVDTRALPECGASDAELMASGASACPASTVVGKGAAKLDTGFPGPGRFATADFTFLNARDQLVFVSTIRGSEVRVVLRGHYSHGNRFDVDVPPLPGAPPDGGAETHEMIDLAAHARKGHVYVRTPRSCPRSGKWTNAVTYTFRDGVKQTFKAHSPCRRRKGATRLAVRLRGVPRRHCVRRSFAVRAHATAPARQVTLYLDGRRIGKSRTHDLRARVRAAALRSGRHRIKAIGRNARGRAAVDRARFRHC